MQSDARLRTRNGEKHKQKPIELPGVPKEWVNVIRAWAAEDERIAAVYVFGSRVKGTHKRGSDIDLAVSVTDRHQDAGKDYWMYLGGERTTLLAERLHIRVCACCLEDEDAQITVGPAVKEYSVKLY